MQRAILSVSIRNILIDVLIFFNTHRCNRSRKIALREIRKEKPRIPSKFVLSNVEQTDRNEVGIVRLHFCSVLLFHKTAPKLGVTAGIPFFVALFSIPSPL